MTTKSFLYKSSKINYRLAGDGQVVLLIHGFAEDSTVWDMQFDKLAEEFKVIAIDLPGSGKSEVLGAGTESDHAGIDLMAEAIHQLIKSEKVESLIMIGHSMGGYITLAFAEKYPVMLKAFGLFHSSAFADDEEKKQTRLKAIDHIHQYGSESFLRTSIPNLFAQKFKKDNADFIEQFIKKHADFKPAALSGYYYAMINRPERINVLKEFPRPILFIIGEEDNAIPLAASLKQCYLPNQAHVHILTQTGHMGMIEESSATIDILLDFCRAGFAVQP